MEFTFKNELLKSLYSIWLGACLGFTQIDIFLSIGIIFVTVFLVHIRKINPLNLFERFGRNNIYTLWLGASLAFSGIGIGDISFWVTIIGVGALVGYRDILIVEENLDFLKSIKE